MPAAMLHCVSHDEMFGSHNILAAHGRGGLVTLTRQSNQSAFQQKGFFAARGVCPANQAKPGLQYFCPGDPCALRTLHAKHCYALPRAWPALFCLISAEAVLLKENPILPVIAVRV
jgi:hypothetical protein